MEIYRSVAYEQLSFCKWKHIGWMYCISETIWFEVEMPNAYSTNITNTMQTYATLFSNRQQDHRICVAGMILQYLPKKGLFKFDAKYYNTQNTYLANLTKSFSDHYIATCEPSNVLTNLDENKLGEVPCNVKWSNSHRIDPSANTSCIHFSAASEGKILYFIGIKSRG